MTCARIFDSAAYVLGTLPADEVADYQRHLATCAECQAEVMEFGGLPRLLSTVNLGEVESRWAGPTVAAPASDEQRWAGPTVAASASAPDERWARPTAQPSTDAPTDNVLPFVITKVRKQRAAQRRRGRLQTVGMALVAACVAALAVVVVQRQAEDPVPQMVAMQQVSNTSPVTASVGLEPIDGGTRLVMSCRYTGAPKGVWTFRMYVVPKAGNAEEVGSWTAGPGEERNYAGWTRFNPGEIKEVQLRKGDQTVLMTRSVY
jgi:anti-sigma factor RsiW